MLKAPILLGAVPPSRTRKDDSVERSLATVHEAHQKALATVSTLEEEIERLNHTWAQSQSRARSKSRDCQWQSREGQKERCCQVWFEEQPAPSHSANPKTQLGEEGSNGRASDLEEPLELKPTVASFLRGSPETSEDEGKKTPLEPAVLEFSRLGPMEGREMPDPRIVDGTVSAVPGKEDSRKLAREVRASFVLPLKLQELGSKEANSPGSPCTAMPSCRQKFMLPADSIFVCRDIREIPREKVVAYARALQHCVQSKIICLLEVSHDYWVKIAY